MTDLGYITGQFWRPDSNTTALTPEAAGTVTFTQLSQTQLTSGTVSQRIITTEIDATGALAEGGVWLVHGWWSVVVRINGAPEHEAYPIEVKPEHTADAPLKLHLVAPISPPPGVMLVPSEDTRRRAEAAATAAEASAAVATSGATTAAAAAQNATEHSNTATAAATRAATSANDAESHATEAEESAHVASTAATAAAGQLAAAISAAERASTAAGDAQTSANRAVTAAAQAADAGVATAQDAATALAARDDAQAAADRAEQARDEALAVAPRHAIADLTNGASSGSITLVAHGDVTAQMVGIVKAGTAEHIAAIPTGYAPDTESGHGFLIDHAGEWWPAYVTPQHIIVAGPPPAGTTLRGSLTWKAATTP